MDVERWVVLYVSVVTGTDSEKLDRKSRLAILDFDSVDSVQMALEFEKTFETEVDPALFLNEQLTLEDLTEELQATVRRKSR